MVVEEKDMSLLDKKNHITPQSVASAMFENDVAAQRLGIKIECIKEGYAELSMTVADWMIQGHNICHGGFIFSLADTAMAYASNGRNKVNVAMNANIDFLKPVKLGECLKAIAVEGSTSKNTGLYDVKVYNEKNDLTGHFRGRTFNTQADII